MATQCIEVAAQEDRQLYAAFLDISKAYDTVDQGVLWNRRRELGLEEKDVELLHALYCGTSMQVEWEGDKMKQMPASRGLRQGCPLFARFLGYR